MAYTLIASQTLLNPTATVTFSGIPQGFKDLMLEFNGGIVKAANIDSLLVQFNNDTGSNYSYTDLSGNGTTASSTRQSSATYFWCDVAATNLGLSSVSTFNVMSYANTNVYKTTLYREATAGNDTEARVSLWRSTTAITSIKLFPYTGSGFATGSTFKLWGVF